MTVTLTLPTGAGRDLAIVHRPIFAPSPLARYQPAPSRRQVTPDTLMVAGSLPGPNWNFVIVTGPVEPADLLARAASFFPADFAITVELPAASAVEAALIAAGWQLDEEEPALVLDPIPPLPPTPPGLSIRVVATDADLAAFFAVSGMARHRIPTAATARDPEVALLVGSVAGAAVATARLTLFGEVGEITSIVTLPAQRRRGYGAALTVAAIAEAQRRGATAITLNATPLGYPVYTRLGFRPVCLHRTYLPPGD